MPSWQFDGQLTERKVTSVTHRHIAHPCSGFSSHQTKCFRGDHTFADSYLTVLPRGTEFVVFSIDGSFAASVSIMGSDPKVRAGAVDVVR